MKLRCLLSVCFVFSGVVGRANCVTPLNSYESVQESALYGFGAIQSDGTLPVEVNRISYRVINSKIAGPAIAISVGTNDLLRVDLLHPISRARRSAVETSATFTGSAQVPDMWAPNDSFSGYNYTVVIEKSKRGTSMKVTFDFVTSGRRVGGATLEVFDSYEIIPDVTSQI